MRPPCPRRWASSLPQLGLAAHGTLREARAGEAGVARLAVLSKQRFSTENKWHLTGPLSQCRVLRELGEVTEEAPSLSTTTCFLAWGLRLGPLGLWED